MADTEHGLLLADSVVEHSNTPGSAVMKPPLDVIRECFIKYKYTITWCLRLLCLAMAALNIHDVVRSSPHKLEVFYGPLASSLHPATLVQAAVITSALRWMIFFLCLEVFGWYTPRTRLYEWSLIAFFFAIVFSFEFVLVSYRVHCSSSCQVGILWTNLGSHIGPTLVATVKVVDLGWPRAGLVLLEASVIFLTAFQQEARGYDGFPDKVSGLCALGVSTLIQNVVLGREAIKKTQLASEFRETDRQFAQSIDRQVIYLASGAVISVLDCIHMVFLQQIMHTIGVGTYSTLDFMITMGTVVFLGEVGLPDGGETLQELAYIAKAQSKRVTFSGKLNLEAKHCIVSFPGKYAEEPWLRRQFHDVLLKCHVCRPHDGQAVLKRLKRLQGRSLHAELQI